MGILKPVEMKKCRDNVMNRKSKCHSILCLTLVAVNCLLYTQLIHATEWPDYSYPQTGFSEFAPPSTFHEYSDNDTKKQWRSGSSFNDANKVRYLPVTTKNPWKPVSSMHYKKSFSSQRPWGNVPDRKPPRVSNMKFHDQRFKQWSRQLDASYLNNIILSDPLGPYGSATLPFNNGYAYPGAIYHNPLITPVMYPRGILPVTRYGVLPYTGLSTSPWRW